MQNNHNLESKKNSKSNKIFQLHNTKNLLISLKKTQILNFFIAFIISKNTLSCIKIVDFDYRYLNVDSSTKLIQKLMLNSLY